MSSTRSARNCAARWLPPHARALPEDREKQVVSAQEVAAQAGDSFGCVEIPAALLK